MERDDTEQRRAHEDGRRERGEPSAPAARPNAELALGDDAQIGSRSRNLVGARTRAR
jgi:hypothetical protein